MKKILKYVIAVVMFLTVGIGFMPILSLGVVELSVADIIKIGFGGRSDGSIVEEVQTLLREYVSDYSYYLLILMLGILFAAAMTAALSNKNAYLASLICQVVINLFAGIMFFQMTDKIRSIRDVIDFFGMGDYIYVISTPAIVWVVVYVIILFLTSYGILLKEEDTAQVPGDIIEESFHHVRNPRENTPQQKSKEQMYLDRIQELEAQKSRKPKRQVMIDKVPENHMREEDTVADTARLVMPGKVPKAAEKTNQDFQGAIVGKSGIYHSKAYMMKDRIPVYFCGHKQPFVTTRSTGGEGLAKVYYVAEYQEYCVIPMGMKKVFLESGQPLGATREYYLPRGTEIYLEDNRFRFLLA
ncbi:hypothetical protein [Faecalicatena contorta]|uniref:hypothetical protein n=1 Tax=Faecalicatena contorta TaxID=39482 RepID=UPI001F38F932|nr:hypothetical protein [Faecalicatena contorta]MCF2682736.1 hypothetical protein [Faecalicatena contorta]